MERTVKNLSWRWLKQEGGAQIAEFAAVVPMLVMMLLGILWFGRALSIYTTVNHAARAAAEAAVLRNCATCASPNTLPSQATIKTNVVDPIFQAAHLDSSSSTLTFTLTQGQPMDSNSTVLGAVVTMSYPYSFKMNRFTCCPPGLAPATFGLTIKATAQSQQEN
ncbi:MAG TPA: TadE family protein [Terriglobales bacterium]|nr:TadE family protein [Terriglobales bacterium]